MNNEGTNTNEKKTGKKVVKAIEDTGGIAVNMEYGNCDEEGDVKVMNGSAVGKEGEGASE